MLLDHSQELGVLDIPEGVIGAVLDQQPDVSEELSESNVRGHLPKLDERSTNSSWLTRIMVRNLDPRFRGVVSSQFANGFDAGFAPGLSFAMRISPSDAIVHDQHSIRRRVGPGAQVCPNRMSGHFQQLDERFDQFVLVDADHGKKSPILGSEA